MDVARSLLNQRPEGNLPTDRDGNVAVPFGKVSFDTDKLVGNLKTIEDVVTKARQLLCGDLHQARFHRFDVWPKCYFGLD